ncbi:MAG: DUF2306 domain-containing protein [Alphaproteobacteria bacterium]|nr:DUF2306 domain-containing protein [Alphaproteobacteria bacterium]
MEVAVGIEPRSLGSQIADRSLRASAALWFLIAAAGQWLFVAFILGFYGAPTMTGNFEAWDKNKFLTHGYIAGDTVGNLAFAAHVMLAAIITFGGTLQLVPQIRARAISFHRWNGRVFILTAFVISLTGLFMNATRGSTGLFDHLAITLNAILIMFCAGQTIGYAMARDIDAHRRWALRTFMVVNGVWFLRVGMMGYMAAKIVLFGGPKGFDADFYAFWSYGSYLVPLAVLQLYFLAQDGKGGLAKVAMALLLVVLAAGTAAGIVGVTMIIWWPQLTTT